MEQLALLQKYFPGLRFRVLKDSIVCQIPLDDLVETEIGEGERDIITRHLRINDYHLTIVIPND